MWVNIHFRCFSSSTLSFYILIHFRCFSSSLRVTLILGGKAQEIERERERERERGGRGNLTDAVYFNFATGILFCQAVWCNILIICDEVYYRKCYWRNILPWDNHSYERNFKYAVSAGPFQVWILHVWNYNYIILPSSLGKLPKLCWIRNALSLILFILNSVNNRFFE